MQLSTRYGLIGIAALALLSLVHWVRDRHVELDPIGTYLRGVTPNFAAAIAISFVLLSIWADRKRNAGFASLRNRFLGCAAISGVGLIGWELLQSTSRNFVFDGHDMLATLVGIATAAALFRAVTPRQAGDAA